MYIMTYMHIHVDIHDCTFTCMYIHVYEYTNFPCSSLLDLVLVSLPSVIHETSDSRLWRR